MRQKRPNQLILKIRNQLEGGDFGNRTLKKFITIYSKSQQFIQVLVAIQLIKIL
jgi:hypothetical protein